MVTMEARRTAREVNDLLDTADPVSLATVAGSTAGGVIVAQRLGEFVLDFFRDEDQASARFDPSPGSLSEALILLGTKGGGALATGYAATSLDGLPQVAAAFASVGMLASGGVDVVSTFIDSPEAAAIQNKAGGGQSHSSGGMTVRSVTAGGSGSHSGSTHSGGEEMMESSQMQADGGQFASM